MRRQEPALKEFRFQSIAALYQKAIKPLYEQAFRNKWVINNNRNLVDELLSPEFNTERAIPTGPVYRSQNSDSFAQQNKRRYHVDAKTIDDIISEIVEEGEGTTNFEENVQGLLDKVQELGEADAYLKMWLAERHGDISSRSWLEKYEKLRQSHLYRFAMILTALMDLTKQLPFYFNACYLVMIMWFSRIYESANWQNDKSRRHAIEMFTTFPIMSLGIRPFLELASFFPIEELKLFSLDMADLPQLSSHAKELHALYTGVERTETIIKKLDNLALHTHEQNMILTRLNTLAVLREFKKQFPFRKHGGYSDDLPDFTYQQGYLNSHTFEENPFKDYRGDTKKLYEDVLLLRIRFSGWSRAQLPTDPDPPNDEFGCTGIQRLHASDGHRTQNRALIWQQNHDGTEIVREPADNMLSKKMNQKLSISGLHKIWRFEPTDITGANEKNGYKPLLLGENRLVWKNGEPIDPFIIGVTIDAENKSQSVLTFQREIFNMNKRMINMEPLEQVLTARGPHSFGTVKQIPA
ncbi:hypothetical protein I4U23_000104 [Adineta vaga]|nr:hypothetical protein I4U23_000104 [Adineta vaga]